MTVAWEKISDTRYTGYVSDTGTVALFSNISLRAVQGDISKIIWDQSRKLNFVTFSSRGNFILEPSDRISEAGSPPGVVLIPNPSVDGHFLVEIYSGFAGNVRLSVSDLSGKKLLSLSLQSPSGKSALPVDLSAFPPGMYLLTITTAGGSQVKKMVRL